MKLGIDISQIVYKGSGVARYTEGIVSAILNYDTSNSWHFYFSSLRQQLDPKVKELIIQKGHKLHEYWIPPTFLSIWFNNLHAISKKLPPLYAIPRDLDWFITSDWTEPHINSKKVTIVHDLIFRKFPEMLPKSILKTQSIRMKHVVDESDLIICVSDATANDMQEEYRIDPARLFVNYTGINPKKEPLSDIFQKYNLHKPFILTVGKLEPRKNIKRLIDAFKKAETTAQLVIVGAEGWGESVNPVSNDDIRFLGYVSDEDLAALYAHALFFVYPSLYEGFGYPILEAMKYGCPVATSNTSSMKEIAEGNALLFSPEKTDEIAASIEELFNNEPLRAELKAKGLAHASSFTWERYYNKLITELERRK
ncbi:glycosyltransferase family 4 protein [Candidatus Woesebacteria bacterium]|nr:glycosyltransferase family 4 protein [Candidatus Woesebacteria bacterium]